LEVAAVEERIDNSGKKSCKFTLAFCNTILNFLYSNSNCSIRGVKAGRRGEDAGGSGKASPQDIRDLRRGESGWSPFPPYPCFIPDVLSVHVLVFYVNGVIRS
jgi:hypothetical protein